MTSSFDPNTADTQKYDASDQFTNTVALIAKQDQIVWMIFGIFWAANAVLLVALFTTGKLPDRAVGIIVSAVGTILSLVWALVQYRAVSYLKFYEAILYQIEKEYLSVPKDIALSGYLNENLYGAKVGRGIRVRGIMIGSCIASTIGWSVSVAAFVCR